MEKTDLSIRAVSKACGMSHTAFYSRGLHEMNNGERADEMAQWKSEKYNDLEALKAQVIAMGVYSLAYRMASYEDDRKGAGDCGSEHVSDEDCDG